MDIIWHGHSCFTIKGKDATIVTDPFEGLGVKLPKLKADIVSVSGEGELAEVDGNPKVLDWPGEFEVCSVAIESINLLAENLNIFIFAIDGIKICHLSALSHELSEELVNQIGEVDILMVPVGGAEVLDGKLAQKVVEAIEPRMVIPMFFAATDTKLGIGGPADFLKAMGKTEVIPAEKFSINSRASLPEDRMDFALLAPKI
ncbi:MAG: MBL fold metallo-hydrolase [Candidatus Gracilibacteria bacterium]|jgi:L-ascorbate metabolism protein UlaG (beta-lactamase superfamily)